MKGVGIMRNLRRVQGLVLLLAFFGTLMTMGNVEAAGSVTLPPHITNLANLFAAPPAGSNSQPTDSEGVTVITKDLANQSGVIWSKPANKMDLTKNFKAEMLLNFGNKGSNAADGMAFVMHNDARGTNTIQTGGNGQQLGVWGSTTKVDVSAAIQNSLAIEFDTNHNENWDTRSGVLGSINLDAQHIAWNYPAKSDSYKNFGSWLFPKIRLIHMNDQSFPGSDNKWYAFTVEWTASTRKLKYTFEGNSPVEITVPADAFGAGATSVYWGFTAKTGDSSEENKVAFASVSNVPKTSQNYQIYHQNADGSQGAVVTQTNPAKPNEKLLGIVTANNISTDGQMVWSDVALRYNEGTTDDRGIRYLAKTGLTINDQNISTNGVSTGLFTTSKWDTDGNPIANPAKAVDTNIFEPKDSAGFGLGVNTGNIAPGGQSVIKMQLTAMDPTDTNGKTNMGQQATAWLANGTVGQKSTFMTYVTSIPTMTLNGQFLDTTAKNPAIVEKNKAFNLTGNWEQSSKTGKIDADAKGTLHYSIDDGAEQTVALDSTGGAMSAPIPTAGLTMNQPHKMTVYVTNAGYNEKSNTKTAFFQIKGGELKFAKVNPTVVFNPVQVGKTVTAQRATTDWAPTVADSRGRDSQWTLSASTTGLTRTTDGKKLAGRMMYVDGQKQTPLTSTPIVITSKTTTTDNEELTAVNWAADQGILLNVNADAYVGDYTGTVDWTLASVPEP